MEPFYILPTRLVLVRVFAQFHSCRRGSPSVLTKTLSAQGALPVRVQWPHSPWLTRALTQLGAEVLIPVNYF